MGGRAARVVLALFAWLLATGAGASFGGAAPHYFRECPDCPELAVIPGGRFVMGSPPGEAGRFRSEGPRHMVRIQAFALGRHDVTVKEFLTFLRQTGYQPKPCSRLLDLEWHSPGHGRAYPPGGADAPDQPAVCVGWQDAQAYVAWLNAKVRLPGRRAQAGPYRLPSEAEWEYAARAGTATARWWGESVGTDKANCNGCGSPWDDRLFAPVDSFGPNPFGLYDMLGNVWQWTQDCWHPGYVGAPADGRPWMGGACRRHVLRGGSWSDLPVFVRSAARIGGETHGDAGYSGDTGFRVARTIRPSGQDRRKEVSAARRGDRGRP